MSIHPVWSEMQARLRRGEKTRILAFGSSNTERFLTGMHWLDVVELAVRDTYGRVHHCINAGVGGDTSRDLLRRYEADAAPYRPHLTIITIGGNDSSPERDLPADEFAENLRELYRRFREAGSEVVFQTYYAPDPARHGNLPPFYRYMDVVRAVAQQTGAGLVDHLARWEPFRQAHPERYLAMMQDCFHVNARGNLVLGLLTARHLDARPAPAADGFWDEALGVLRDMDAGA